MNRILLTIALAVISVCSAMAEGTPGLKITLSTGDVEIALSTIKNITYQDASTMIVNYNDGTAAKQYTVSDVVKMTLTNVESAGIEDIDAGNAESGVYQVFDTNGRLVEKGEYTGSLPSLSNLNAGAYIVKMGSRSVKIVKK